MNGQPTIFDLNPYAFSSVQNHQLGARVIDGFGDSWRYAKIGASNASAGQLQLAPVQKTNHHNVAATVAVTANGLANQVTLQLGATAATAGEYNGGFLIANDNSPEGEMYRIVSHPAAGSGETLTVTVERPFLTSITTSSEFTLVHNSYNGVVVGTTVTIPAAGVPVVDATAAYFGWLKTRGPVSVLIGSAATLGADLIVGGTNGAVTDRTDALGASGEPVVGVCNIAVGVTGEYNPITLLID